MIKVSLRNLLVNKLRLFLTVAAVTVGVAFVSGTFVLSDTMVKAFDELYTGITSDTDVVVKSKAAYDADVTTNGGQVRPLDDDLVATVRDVAGVEVAQGSVFGFAIIVDKHGEAIQPGGAPTFGTSISADRRLDGDLTFRDGRAPRGGREMVMDARTARKAGFELGTAQRVLGKVGVVDEIDIKAEDGMTARELRHRVAAVLPAGVEAITGEQAAADGTAAVRDLSLIHI